MLVTQQWLWLLGLFLFASADGSHRALLTQESSGLAIVLRHDAPGASPVRGHDRSFGHEHCLPAKLLTLLAEDRTSQTDHVIQFSAAVPHLTNPASASPMPSASFVFPPVLTSALPQYLPAHALPLLQPRPPPVASALLLQLRSTVLLI
ncbi:MAG: hypothetical protein EBU23_13515 [Mycobacteriaceae bacterium]|nr:hypothetical protein [Mycobacteriaceae bacterium]